MERMSARMKRERAEYAGYGWAWCAFFLGMLALGLLIGPGAWTFARLIGLIVSAVGARYGYQEYEKAQRKAKSRL